MTCTQCGTEMLSGSDGFGRAYYCPGCGNATTGKACMPKLPGLDPGPQHRAIQERETALARRIGRRLELAGYTVLFVGQGIAKHSGTTKGTPDMFVTRRRENTYKGIEVKLPGYSPSDVSPAQQKLVDDGESVIVTSEIEALEAMQETGELSRV
jgi:hypothetical protein